jgi:adenosylcobinamide-phosphate synthase
LCNTLYLTPRQHCRCRRPAIGVCVLDAREPALLLCLTLCGVALVAEALVGYPPELFMRIGHPVTWIGALIALLDARLNRESDTPARRRIGGFAALGLLLGVAGGLAFLLQACIFAIAPTAIAILLLGIVASTCLAQRSLDAHVGAVADALAITLEDGRRAVAMIVGRDTTDLDDAGVARAALESLAENFADGIVAPTLWLALLGLPGGVLYKAINTADSMIGHRTPRHEAFGFASAKLDDIVNWPAARLAGLWIVLAAALTRDASAKDAWRIMRRDARGHASPNAGWPEAAMAGALGITLGGTRVYAGRTVADRGMGDGTATIDAATINRALRLYRIACAINIAAVVVPAIVIARW